jgi:hypothetical protein
MLDQVDIGISGLDRRYDAEYAARAWVQREAGEGETQGENFIFSDLGHYATQGEAASRGESWAIRWINENDY